jgi:hypothetical protein
MKKTFLFLITTILLLFSSNIFCQTYEIYVSDAGDFQTPSSFKIFKFDENGENPEVFINDNLAWPQDILFLEDQGVVLVSSLNSGRITKHNAATGDFIEDFASGISGPTRMKIGADSLLYVLQWQGDYKVKRYELDGTFVDDFTSVGVLQSIGLDWDSDGNLYVSTYAGSKVRKFDPEGNDLGFFTESNLQGPTNIWFNESGEMLANNWNGSTVSRFDSEGNFIDNFITGLSNPEGISIYPNGNILIGNGGTSAVKLFDPNGNFIEDLIPSGSGGLQFPNAVILRDVTPVSVAQIVVKADFIQPTIGTDFFLNSVGDQKVKSISVYNQSGVLIEAKEITSNQIWKANKYPDGLYIIIGKSNTGEVFTQKVIVQK